VAEPKGKTGRNGKVDVETEAKKPDGDEDFSDVEAEFAGDGESEAVEEAEVKAAKVKPLRMKVSRAKERALMREFGLDETALTEEEVAKRRLELKTLIKMGKTRVFSRTRRSTTTCPRSWSTTKSSRPSSRCSTTWASRCMSRRPMPRPC